MERFSALVNASTCEEFVSDAFDKVDRELTTTKLLITLNPQIFKCVDPSP